MTNEYADPTLQKMWDNKVSEFEAALWRQLFTNIALLRIIEENRYHSVYHAQNVRIDSLIERLKRLEVWT